MTATLKEFDNLIVNNAAVQGLETAYYVGNHFDCLVDYACRNCAEKFAEDRGLIFLGAHDYTEEHEGGYFAYALNFDRGETDYPVSCRCGQYLDVSLTDDGVAYMQDNEFPAWLYRAHGVSVDSSLVVEG